MLYSRRAKDPLNYLKCWFLGSPLRTTAQKHEQLGLIGGLAVLGSDALSSVAYATEEIMLGLSVLGVHSFPISIPIACAIVLTLFIVIFSYRQTVEAYPNGGGAYIVAKHQLGRMPALIAAGSLLMDYVLTVAVSIAAGVRSLTSLAPSLLNYSVEISVGAVAFLCWINLRGMRESVRVFALPLYGFILSMLGLCAYGFIGGAPAHQASIPPCPWSIMDFAAILVILRAFSGGCTALTGIEAIANAGPLIKEPHVKNAQRLYMLLAGLLAILFIGITVLTQQFHLVPTAHESLLSQLVRLLFGNGWVYIFIQISTCTVLFLAANTAFADYPRLCAILARDGWLPSQLGAQGDRLVLILQQIIGRYELRWNLFAGNFSPIGLGLDSSG